jgi:hypothetical protein
VIKDESPQAAHQVLWVASLSNDRLDFRVTPDLAPKETSPCSLRVIAKRRQLVTEFVKKFKAFLKNDYHPEHWRMSLDLREMDLSKIMLALQK